MLHLREVHRTPRTDPFCYSDLELYQCSQCEFETCISVSLKNHVDTTHNNLQVDHNLADLLQGHLCKDCKLNTFSIFVLAKHDCKKAILDKGNGTKKYFTISSEMEVDEEREAPWNYHTCNVCPKKRTTEVSTKLQHIGESHRTPRTDHFCQRNLEILKCRYCEYETNFEVSLKKHVNITHNNLQVDHNLENLFQGYSCRKCNLNTFSVFILAKHDCKKSTVDKRNDTKKYFACEDCQREFSRKDGLRLHILYSHTPDDQIKWFQCEQCPYKFKEKGNLKRHILHKHTLVDKIKWVKWFQCEHCPYKCKVEGNLKRHILHKHTLQDKIEWFECRHCPHKCKQKVNLERHILHKHTLEDNIEWVKCGDCPYKCKEKSKLKRHIILKHTSEDNIEWIKCEHCPLKYKQRQFLNRHIRSKHT